MFALFLSRLGQQRVNLAPLLCCPLGQAMKSARGKNSTKALEFHSRVRLTHTPALHLLSLAVTSGRSRHGGWDGEGAGARSFGPRPALLSGEHTPEWDPKLVSKSLSKDSFQPECSIVSLTARCRPPPTLHV